MKKLALIAILALTVSLAGCNKNNQNEPQNNEPEATRNEVTNEVEVTEVGTISNEEFAKEAQRSDEIVDSGVMAECETLNDNNLQAECKLNIAIDKATENQDPSECNVLESEEDKQFCKEEAR